MALSACGSSDPSLEPSTQTALTSPSTPAESTTPSSTASVDARWGLPSDFEAPTGWVQAFNRYDPSSGTMVLTSDDPRFTAFEFIVEGCCDAGLDARFGSPDFPDSDDALDLGDGLYYASIAKWNPDTPDSVTLEIKRVVDCGTPEGVDTYYCPIHEFEEGRFEAANASRFFRLILNDSVTVQISAALEPVDGDEYYSNYVWIGQGPELVDYLIELHSTYSRAVTDPFRSGASFADIAAGLYDEPSFREVVLEGWMPFGVWQPDNGPALMYDKPDSLVPICFDVTGCIDGGDPLATPQSFESLIGRWTGLHVVGGRLAFMLPGATLGG